MDKWRYRAAELQLWLACQDLNTLKGWVRWQVALAKDWLQERPALRSFLESQYLLLGVLLLDWSLGFLPSFRPVYLVPVWWATLRTSKPFAFGAIASATIITSLIDGSNHHFGWAKWCLNFALNGSILYVLMRGLDELEARFRQVSRQATQDALTGAHNRIAFTEFCEKAISRTAVTGEGFVIALVDCDQFKALNDTYGHAFGDLVLQHLTRSLRRSLPNNAMVARLGGDEFAVAVPGRSVEWVESALFMARQRLQVSHQLEGRSVDFSFGVSQWHVQRQTLSEILGDADANLYQRKRSRAGIWFEPSAMVV